MRRNLRNSQFLSLLFSQRDICPPCERSVRRDAAAQTSGFTLLEMVAVLFVVGMAASIVIPRLPAMQASLSYAIKHDSFEQTMNALAYTAFKENQDFILSGTYDDHGHIEDDNHTDAPGDDIPGQMRVLPLIATTRAIPQPVTPATITPSLPEGWRLVVTTPIQYRASGYCTGGNADLEIGRRRYTYRFNPPLCEITLER